MQISFKEFEIQSNPEYDILIYISIVIIGKMIMYLLENNPILMSHHSCILHGKILYSRTYKLVY